jgi:hypothetical protein
VSKKQIALVILLVVVIALVIAALVVDNKYAVLWGSPRISHDKFVKPETRAQLVLDIPLAKDLIKRQFLKDVPVPDWALPKALPYEAALVMNLNRVMGDMNVALFVNDQRLGPFILEKANQIRIPKPFDQWFPEKMVMKGRGELLKTGVGQVDQTLLTTIKNQWKDPAPTQPLKIEGGHMAELLLDNRDGGAVAIIGAIAALEGADVNNAVNPGRVGFLANIASLRLQGDVMPDNALTMHLAVECTPETEPAQVQMIQFALDMGMPDARDALRRIGLDLQGKSAVDGKAVKGDYSIPHFDAFLARL